MKKIKVYSILFFILGSFLYSKIFIGAYDPQHWAGLVFYTFDKEGFGIYLEIEKNGERVSGYDIYYLIKKVGFNTGDGNFAELEIDTSLPFKKKSDTPIRDKSISTPYLNFKWSKINDDELIAQIHVKDNLNLFINFYSPFQTNSIYDKFDDFILGRTDNYNFYFKSKPVGRIVDTSGNFRIKYSIKKEGVIEFRVKITKDYLDKFNIKYNISSVLKNRKINYDKNRVKVNGNYKGLVESITNNINWMVGLQPEVPRLYTPAGRRWIFPSPDNKKSFWTIFEWDAFFNALELSVQNYELALDTIKSVLNTQYKFGNIPNWRNRYAGSSDRAQPPVSSFVVLKLYQMFKDKKLLEYAYPYLKKFNLYWTDKVETGFSRRDGNDDGLLEWGSDEINVNKWVPKWEKGADGRTRAAWESGQDDLPNFDDVKYNKSKWTLEMNCVDLNSLFALDNECLSIIASILGYEEDVKIFTERYLRIKFLMNEKMWDDEVGIYKDLYWNGKLSKRIAASNFYPLIAGIPDKKRANRMIEILKDSKFFWGKYVIPTISKNDKAYKDQQYWRGTIWPPTNYLVYEGVLRYEYYDLSNEIANKSLNLFLKGWNKYQLCRENYNSITGEGSAMRYQSWGPLFALIGLEEYVNIDHLGSVKIGGFFNSKYSVLKNYDLFSNKYEIGVGKNLTKISINGIVYLYANGPIIIKDFNFLKNEFNAIIISKRETEVNVPYLKSKKYRIRINNKKYTGQNPQFIVKSGEFKIKIIGE